MPTMCRQPGCYMQIEIIEHCGRRLVVDFIAKLVLCEPGGKFVGWAVSDYRKIYGKIIRPGDEKAAMAEAVERGLKTERTWISHYVTCRNPAGSPNKGRRAGGAQEAEPQLRLF